MKTPLTYGIGITFANAVVTLIFHLLGYSTSVEKFGTYMIAGMASALAIMITGLVLGARSERAQRGAAGISFGGMFKTCFLITVVAAVTGAVFQAVYFTFLNPGFAEVTIEWTRGLMENMGARAGDIERAMDDMRAKSTVARQAINGTIFTLILGSLASLIIAAILKRAPADRPGELPPSLA